VKGHVRRVAHVDCNAHSPQVHRLGFPSRHGDVLGHGLQDRHDGCDCVHLYILGERFGCVVRSGVQSCLTAYEVAYTPISSGISR